MELEESYGPFAIRARSARRLDGRWSVSAELMPTLDPGGRWCRFDAPPGESYLLEIEALKAGINLGKNLVDRGLGGR